MQRVLLWGVCVSFIATIIGGHCVHAEEGNFALQVSPSPLVTTVKPGESKIVELKIRNASPVDEDLKIEVRTFTVDKVSGDVVLDDTLAPGFAEWLTLPSPGFVVKAGQWSTQQIGISLPQQTGFSYSFALIISRNVDSSTTASGQLLRGSVAVFTLINVDRPDATRQLELVSFEPEHKVYEYLPATLTIKLKNTGNSIVQPYGNLFIQRSSGDSTPLATLPVNDARGYILPGTERTLRATWEAGFPKYSTTTDASGVTKTSLDWNIDHLREFRFGKYTARLVAVYNDGTRDIPITAEVSFWVIPWKSLAIIAIALIIIVLLLRHYLRRRTRKAVEKALRQQKADQQS